MIAGRPTPPNPRDHYRSDIRHEDPDHITLWQDWFIAHGIDPAEVLLTELVERRDYVDWRDGTTQYQIVWYEVGERDGQEITVHKEVDLTAPPLPFPVP